jgi:hypothetical protein
MIAVKESRSMSGWLSSSYRVNGPFSRWTSRLTSAFQAASQVFTASRWDSSYRSTEDIQYADFAELEFSNGRSNLLEVADNDGDCTVGIDIL